MKSRAAVLWGIGEAWKVEDIDIGAPAPGEVLVRWQAAGLCHSEEHFVTGDFVMPEDLRRQVGMPSPFPMIGGHEGAGLVAEVGAGVRSVSVGDSVATSFIPTCGRCRYCVTGRQNLCNQGAQLMQPGQMVDGVVRHFCGGEALNLYAKCGTFAEHSLVSEESVIKVDSDLPPAAVARLGLRRAPGRHDSWGRGGRGGHRGRGYERRAGGSHGRGASGGGCRPGGVQTRPGP
jgi:S-(hydroxymethyl)glutathione dehydrogenase/alcohol dehydrogenase